IMEYLVKISKKARILELKQRHLKIIVLTIQYAISIKKVTAYLCLHFTKDHKGSRINTSYLEESIRRIQVMIDKDRRMGYFKLIRAGGSSKRYSSMIKMLQDIDREDLETLWKLVKAKHKNTRPEEDYERVLWGDLKVMFEPDIKSEIWRNLQGRKAHFLKDKQIPSLGVFDEHLDGIGGNTCDLGSFGEETDEITDLYQILKEVLLTERRDGVAGIKRRRRDPSSDGVRDLVTASGRSRLNEDLESST
ncbi:hypothetical protein Tco_0759627, partial [Tanacetum coccineum]